MAIVYEKLTDADKSAEVERQIRSVEESYYRARLNRRRANRRPLAPGQTQADKDATVAGIDAELAGLESDKDALVQARANIATG